MLPRHHITKEQTVSNKVEASHSLPAKGMLEAAPRVTVMIPSYNGENFIAQALDSLLQQTFRDFEILVVDDASTDNSVEILRAYAANDPRVRLIELPENHGVTFVRQFILQHARGELVAVLDQDDVCLPQRLSRQVAYLDAHPDVVLLGSYYGLLDARGRVTRRQKKSPRTDPEIRWRLTYGNCLIHSTVMYRRANALACGGYDVQYFHGEDMDLLAKIITTGKAAVMPQRLVFWRSHAASVTHYVNVAERDEFYIKIVQRSIRQNLGIEVSFDTATSAYFNGKMPAPSALIFSEALHLSYKSYLLLTEGKSRKERLVLSGLFLQFLLNLKKKNSGAVWWPQEEELWSAYVAMLARYHYHWYLDPGLFFFRHVSFRHMPKLVYISLVQSHRARLKQSFRTDMQRFSL